MARDLDVPEKFRKTPEAAKIARELFKKMRYDVGEAVGVIAAQSISEPATQTTLRSYHAEGRTQLVTTRGLPRLIEIFDARKEPRTPTMAIFLAKEDNTRDGARSVAAKIKETKLKQILDHDSIDLVNMTIEFKPIKEQMEALEITMDELVGLVQKRLKNINATSERGSIKVELKKEGCTIRDLQDARVKIRSMYIKGIKGIEQAIIEEKEGDWIIRTLGSNLAKVLKMKGVDHTRTVSNNIYEIAEVLGIEAARFAIVRETIDTMREQGVDTDIRHLLLVADAMTNSGEIRAIGRYGLAGEKSSVLSRANFEETVKHLIDAASGGEIDPLESVIENIIVGNLAPVGTGMVRIGLKDDE